MDRDFGLPLQGKPERLHLYRWVYEEETYVWNKFDQHHQRSDHDESTASYSIDDFWVRQIVQYYDRARVFLAAAKEADEPGRTRLLLSAKQAAAKAMMTSKGYCESLIRVFGDMPHPGVPSGEVQPWQTPQLGGPSVP